jgi:GNAT superfamily N-acetyltransferase
MPIRSLTGEAILDHLDALAHLRITVFREWPYLYDGDPAYEEKYLRTLAAAPGSVLVIVDVEGEIVGASTGLPLRHETAEFTRPFAEHGLDPAGYFYLGESVLLPEYRGRGFGHAFFNEREAHARHLGYGRTCFAAVQRPDDHTLKPPGYRNLDAFWKGRGYRKHPELRTTFSWKDVDEEAESPKPMVFWLREDKRSE